MTATKAREPDVADPASALLNLARSGKTWIEVANQLNSMGYRSPRGKQWSEATTRRFWEKVATPEDVEARAKSFQERPFAPRTTEEARQRIIELMLNGDHPEQIAAQLNTEGVKPTHSDEWSKVAVNGVWVRWSTEENRLIRSQILKDRDRELPPISRVLELGLEGRPWKEVAELLSADGVKSKTGVPLSTTAVSNIWSRNATHNEKAKRRQAWKLRRSSRSRS